MVKIISSPTNPLIKQILLLSEKSKARRESNTLVVEGQREILLALKGGYKIKTLVFNPAIVSFNHLHQMYGDEILEVELIEVTNLVYNRIAYREGTEGALAIMWAKSQALEDLKILNDLPLILIAEAPEKPGNIGALLRTADAAGADACIIANPNTDIYNPNIIRSSIGCVFTIPIASGSTSAIIEWLKNHKIRIVCATIADDSVSCYDIDYTLPTAIVVGTESTGLSSTWIEAADDNVIIPMRGHIDSMNVSVSASILIYEAVRQRLKADEG